MWKSCDILSDLHFIFLKLFEYKPHSNTKYRDISFDLIHIPGCHMDIPGITCPIFRKVDVWLSQGYPKDVQDIYGMFVRY